MVTDERYSRQRDIVPPDRLAARKATIVGVGAIGRQVAVQLAAVGIPWLQLIDFDRVEESNLASQGYLEADLGRTKVAATGEMCLGLNPALALHTVDERFRRSREVGDVLFACVDSIETRKLIWESTRDRVDFFCDARMSAEVVRIVTVADAGGRGHYPTTLFRPEEAHAGACTAKSTIYTANIAAGLAVGQFTKWLRDLPVEPDVMLNLLTCELDCLDSPAGAPT